MLALFPDPAPALTPAGTLIPNVASTSCLLHGSRFVCDSNTVAVGVVQVSLVSITPQQTVSLNPGRTVSLPQTVTNNGNGTDSYNLNTACPAGFLIKYFAADGVTPLSDSNGDGIVDTGPLASGAHLDIVVTMTAPAGAKPGAVDRIVIGVCSISDPAASANAVSTSTILNPRLWNPLTETVTPSGQLPPGSVLSYTSSFGNDGNLPAGKVVITDQLDPHLVYLEGSATSPAAIEGTVVAFDPATRSVTWSIPSVPAGYRGAVSFQARIDPGTPSDTIIPNSVGILSDQNPELQVSNTVTTPVVEQPLRISKLANKTEAELGDYVGYSVSVENVSTSLIANQVVVIDSFPEGFRYQKGTSRLDGVAAGEPTGGTTRSWEIGSIEPGKKRLLSYRALVSLDAPLGDGVNSARAEGATPMGFRFFSPAATARVKILEGVLNSRATILGRVFADLNRDLMPDRDEPGFKGVRLYLEDGSYAITDGEGKFSFVGVSAGEHVLKLDKSSIPPGYQPESLDSSFAGDGNSRFVPVPFGGIGRGDFGLKAVPIAAVPPPERKKENPAAEREYTFGAELNSSPPPLEQSIATMPDAPEILEPAANGALKKPWTDIVIRVPEGADYQLRVNDEPLLQKQIGQTIVEKKRKLRIYRFVGVKLSAGPNRIVLETTRPGAQPELQEIQVVAPGEAVKMTLTPDKAEIPADGRTAVPVSVRFLDNFNNPVAGELVYTVTTEKGEILEKDFDPAKPGHQLKAVDGAGLFQLRSTLKTGAERIKVSAGTSLEGGIDLFFTPELRDWIVVGLGSLNVGSNSISGNLEKITKDDRFEEGIYEEDRLAFFAKGKILGRYLMTAGYDSRKEERSELFQRVDPNRYYPIYGDASERGYDAESSKKYYLKIEKDRSSVLVGDFNTNLSNTEFSRYDRSFNGVKGELDTKNAVLRAFGTSTNHSVHRDEIPGNGTSGYYFLSSKPIIENTDKVRIEVRDRYHSETVIASTLKTPYTDYSLDLRNGSILFREPVPTLDGNLNPVRIVVLYESENPDDKNYIYGARGAIRSDKGSQLGVTAVVDQQGNGANSLYGVDGAWLVNDSTALKLEAALSDTVAKGIGLAWKGEVSSRLPQTRIDAYYRHIDGDFQNISMSGGESGTEKYGTKIAYTLLEKSTLIADGFVQKDLTNDTKLTSATLGFSHPLKGFTLNSGYKWLQGEDVSARQTSSQMVYAGANGRVTEKLDASLMREQAFSSDTVKDYPTRTVLKLNYRLGEKTTAFITEEYQESGERKSLTTAGLSQKLTEKTVLTTSYQETTGSEHSSQAGTELGTTWEPAKDVVLTTRAGYQLLDSMTGDRGQALLGVDTAWEPLRGLKLGVKAQRIQVVSGTSDPSVVGTALALSAAYLVREDLKTSARYELRLAPAETAALYTLGGAWKLNQSVSLLGKATLWNSDKPSGTDLLFDGELGGAYRPPGRNSLYLLGLVRYKLDSKGSTPLSDEARSLITSFELSRRVNPTLTLDGKYAGKLGWESSSGLQSSSYTDLVLAGATYDLTERWDFGLHAKLMNQYDSGMTSLGTVVKLGYRVYQNVKLAAGYNFSRLNDRDLAGEGYHCGGPFVELKFKFDETTIEGLYGSLTSRSRPPEPAPAPWSAPLPAPGPAAVQLPAPAPAPAPRQGVLLSTMLIEEPIEVLGSVEALKLHVNDREAALPKGDITVRGETVDGVIDLKRGESDRSLEFLVEATGPGKVASWSSTISTGDGAALRVIGGAGAPEPLFTWDGRSDRNEVLKGGEIYRYRLELEYADGSRAASPFRLFGLNRKTAVSMSLAGGAFKSGSAVLSRAAKRILRETALALRSYPGEQIIVEGHTDSVGRDQANLELSRKRSQAAADFLVKVEKIPAGRIVVRWYGRSRPVASNALPEGRELNRRVEVKGAFNDTKRPEILDRHRVAPFARINRSAVTLDETGRFSRTLTQKAERVEIEMGDSQGRLVHTSLALPKLTLLEPAGGEARVVRPGGGGRSGEPVPAGSCRFAGKAEPGGSLTLNGRDVPVAADGSFSFSLELRPGASSYWLQVRNQAGIGRQLRLELSVAPEPEAAAGDSQGEKRADNQREPVT